MKKILLGFSTLLVSASALADNEVASTEDLGSAINFFNYVIIIGVLLIASILIYNKYFRRDFDKKPFAQSPNKSDRLEMQRLIFITKLKNHIKDIESKEETEESISLIKEIKKEIKVLETNQSLWHKRNTMVESLETKIKTFMEQ